MTTMTVATFRDHSDFTARAEVGDRFDIDDSRVARTIRTWVMLERESESKIRVAAIRTRHHGTSQLAGRMEKVYLSVFDVHPIEIKGHFINEPLNMRVPVQLLHQQDAPRYNARTLAEVHRAGLAAYDALPAQ